nr:MAG TPA: hypothetical protein [Caudoviricetes sp.]
MNRTDRIPLSPRRSSLSGRFLCPHAAIFGFHSHACSPCVELIGPASRPRDFFPRRAMANAFYPRLIALNSPRRIHPRHTSHKKWRPFEESSISHHWSATSTRQPAQRRYFSASSLIRFDLMRLCSIENRA